MYHPIYGAANAIDGNMNNIAASNFQPNAWLSVRVPSGARIGLVAVYNRGDGERYQELLGSFEVWVGTSAASQGTRCGGWSGTTRSVGPFVINCGGTSGGEWVTVRQVGNARYLTIGELLAFAEAVPGSTRASPPPPPLSVTPPPPRSATINTIAAVLSSTYGSRFVAAHAIDGDASTLAASRFETNAWISVQVPSGNAIGRVAVINRNDGARYQDLLGTFEVFVGGTSGDTSRVSAYHCGSWTGATTRVGPFVVDCRGVRAGDWVTIRQTGESRLIAIAEVRVYRP